MNLYFTYESRDTLNSFTLFIAVKTIAKLNPEHNGKFEIKIKKKNSRCGLRSPDNGKIWSFHVVVLQRKAKKCTKNYTPRAQTSYCALILLASDVALPLPSVVS